jgi:hypothetical protein
MKSRCFYSWIVGVCLCFAAGCQSQDSAGNWLLIGFEKNVPVTYHFVSDREITIDLTTGDSSKKSKPQTMSEKLEMVITYTPTDVDPFGLTTLTALCQSVTVTRSSLSGRQAASDAMETLAGKKFTFSLTPTGEISDDTDIERIIRELGTEAFSQGDSRRIKNPDMISDFIAMQWHLWDSTSTIDEPLAGMEPGQTWQVRQWVPWPAPIPNLPARLTTYTLDSLVFEENQPRKAMIRSRYELAETAEQPFPRPYDGNFQMRGLMGFLRNYTFISLEGSGSQVFNMDKGLIESDQQHYTMTVNAAFMLPLGDSLPILTIDQTITITQIETP